LNLGYQRAAAEKAIDKTVRADMGFEQALRDVLRALMKG
jgi:Holliday junction resolvasome RuvABC DNA-binding subunit